MKLLSLTISKKLFFIFLINTIITLAITGMVISSFFGISDSIEYNSKVFINYKDRIEELRTEQAGILGLTQGYYLNVNEFSINESSKYITNSISNMNDLLAQLDDNIFKDISSIKSMDENLFRISEEYISNLGMNRDTQQYQELIDLKLSGLMDKASILNKIAKFNKNNNNSGKTINEASTNDIFSKNELNSTVGIEVQELSRLINILAAKLNEIGNNSNNILKANALVNELMPNFSETFLELNAKERLMKTKLRIATLSLVQKGIDSNTDEKIIFAGVGFGYTFKNEWSVYSNVITQIDSSINGGGFGTFSSLGVKGNLNLFKNNMKIDAHLWGSGTAARLKSFGFDPIRQIPFNNTNADWILPDQWLFHFEAIANISGVLVTYKVNNILNAVGSVSGASSEDLVWARPNHIYSKLGRMMQFGVTWTFKN